MKIGINGTGLTSRAILKLIASNDEFKELDICQINGRSMTLDMLKDRMIYSTSQGHSNIDVTIDPDNSELLLNGKRIKYTQGSNPEDIPWDDDIELILEATGVFRDKSKESKNTRSVSWSWSIIGCI